MRRIRLCFYSGEITEVYSALTPESGVRWCVRGKTAGALRGASTFQWTSAVKALTLLLLSSRIDLEGAVLSGGHGSTVASLDYAISKQPCWLVEMFGTNGQGISLARRLILRTNPERKRPGPVLISLNDRYLDPRMIEVVIDGVVENDRERLTALRDAIAGSDRSCFVGMPGMSEAA